MSQPLPDPGDFFYSHSGSISHCPETDETELVIHLEDRMVSVSIRGDTPARRVNYGLSFLKEFARELPESSTVDLNVVPAIVSMGGWNYQGGQDQQLLAAILEHLKIYGMEQAPLVDLPAAVEALMAAHRKAVTGMIIAAAEASHQEISPREDYGRVRESLISEAVRLGLTQQSEAEKLAAHQLLTMINGSRSGRISREKHQRLAHLCDMPVNEMEPEIRPASEMLDLIQSVRSFARLHGLRGDTVKELADSLHGYTTARSTACSSPVDDTSSTSGVACNGSDG